MSLKGEKKMPIKESDYVSEGGKVFVKPLKDMDWEQSTEGPKFSPGMSGTPNNVGQEIPTSQLASDQADFTGPDMSTFTKNEGKFSEDSGLPYNKGDDTGV